MLKIYLMELAETNVNYYIVSLEIEENKAYGCAKELACFISNCSAGAFEVLSNASTLSVCVFGGYCVIMFGITCRMCCDSTAR